MKISYLFYKQAPRKDTKMNFNKAGIVADMHTHSLFSMDSKCKMEDMYECQKKNGTTIYAVTDHFSTSFHADGDIFSAITSSVNAVNEINKKNGDILVLRGVEIGEAFWFYDEYEKIMKMNEYDVVIGSVHVVKFPLFTDAYVAIDFSKVEKSVTADFLDAYFDDMITMISTTDFDILAHLNCPLRYIKGKYNIDMDMLRYEEKIEKILRMIIEKGIALEVNTSGYISLGEPLPSYDIIRKYYSLGGRLVTLGSDAHVAEKASYMFDEAISELKKIGFDNIYYYKDRKPCAIPV